MKKLIAILVLSLGAILFATDVQAASPSIQCASEIPTTAFWLKPSSADAKSPVVLKIKHYWGAHTAPVFQGVVTSVDLGHIQEKINLYQKLGDEIVISFDPEKCAKHGDKIWSCSRSDAFEVNGVPLKGVNFSSRAIDTNVYEYNFRTYQMTFTFIHEGRAYDMPMQYSDYECLFANEGKNTVSK